MGLWSVTDMLLETTYTVSAMVGTSRGGMPTGRSFHDVQVVGCFKTLAPREQVAYRRPPSEVLKGRPLRMPHECMQ